MTTLSKIRSYIRPLSIPHKTSGSSRVLHAVIVIFCEWQYKIIPNCLRVPYCCVQMNKREKGPQAVSQSYPARMTNLLLYWLAWGQRCYYHWTRTVFWLVVPVVYSVSGSVSLLLYRTTFCILDRHDQSANKLKNNNTDSQMVIASLTSMCQIASSKNAHAITSRNFKHAQFFPNSEIWGEFSDTNVSIIQYCN